MQLGLTLEGDKELVRRLQLLARDYPLALGAALYQEGMGIWHDAVKRAPVEFGVLRNSAYTSPPMLDGGETFVEVGFGTHYAVKQHEGTGFHHPRGGEAGFLRNAIAARAGGFLERLAQRTEENVKNNIRAPAIEAPTRPAVKGRAPSRRLRRALARRK